MNERQKNALEDLRKAFPLGIVIGVRVGDPDRAAEIHCRGAGEVSAQIGIFLALAKVFGALAVDGTAPDDRITLDA